MGTIKMTSSLGEGREGYPKVVTKSGIGGRGYIKIVTSPPKKTMYKFLFFPLFWSTQQQLSFGWHFGGGVVSRALI